LATADQNLQEAESALAAAKTAGQDDEIEVAQNTLNGAIARQVTAAGCVEHAEEQVGNAQTDKDEAEAKFKEAEEIATNTAFAAEVARNNLLTSSVEFPETLPPQACPDETKFGSKRSLWVMGLVLGFIAVPLLFAFFFAEVIAPDAAARVTLFWILAAVLVSSSISIMAVYSFITSGALGPLVGVVALLALGLMTFVVFTLEPTSAQGTRVLITSLFVIGTITVAFILVLSVTFGRWPNAVALERFARGKEIFTGLLGILGTIVGFYFGNVESKQPLVDARAAVNIAQADFDRATAAFTKAELAVKKAEEAPEADEVTTAQKLFDNTTDVAKKPDAKNVLDAAKKAAKKIRDVEVENAKTVKNEAEAKKLVAQKALDDATATLKALNGPAG